MEPIRLSQVNVRPEDATWMRRALALAHAAGERGEVPVGAVVILEGCLIGSGSNRMEEARDATCHAEMEALRQAAGMTGSQRLGGATLYVTLEPCAMCAGAAVWSRVDRLVFGARDPKAGACGSLRNVVQDPRLNHRCELIGGVLEEDGASLLRRFFVDRRSANRSAPAAPGG